MENHVEKLLEEILEELRLLTVKSKAESFKKFRDEFLNTEQKQKIYAAIDGQATLPEISERIGCGVSTVQHFAQKLIDNNLVRYVPAGKAKILFQSPSKIAQFYTNKSLEEV